MSYLINKAKVSSLSINGVDYTSSLVSWTAQDLAGFNNGCIVTQGTVTLGTEPSSDLKSDYGRSRFKRGQEIILEMTYPDGTTERHPRGLLYVAGSVYNVESATFEISMACRLGLASLTDEVQNLISLSPLALDAAQQEFSNISAAFASVGKYLYQDSQGNLVSGVYFDGDGDGNFAAGQWTSVLGVTAISAQPLLGAESIPDQIRLSYQVPAGLIASDQLNREDTETNDSYYFIQYPASTFKRINGDASEENPNGTIENAGAASSSSSSPAAQSGCGNIPDEPDGNGAGACSEGYELQRVAVYLPTTRTDTTISYYGGPGAQLSRVYRETYGPAIEANQQYFADYYTYCRSVWATDCQENGDCPFYGMEQIRLAYSEQINYFGLGGELVETVTDVYATTLSAANPLDWRAGIVDGIPQLFDPNLSLTDMYRITRTIQQFREQGNDKIESRINYNSVSSRGVGIKSGINLDAIVGIQTKDVRRSTTNVTLNINPDIANTPTTSTKEESELIRLFSGRFTESNVEEAGPYIEEQSIPMPLLLETKEEIDNAVDLYSKYIELFTKGDSFGLKIAEGLRKDVASNWFPGMPFRFYDPSVDKLFAMRMDATAWGVTPDESMFVTNGVWIGDSNGTVVIPENIEGAAIPNMGGTGEAPGAPSPSVPPSIENETGVSGGALAFDIDVNMMLKLTTPIYGSDGVITSSEASYSSNIYKTFVVYAAGLIIAPGGVLYTTANGSIPVDFNGAIVAEDATVIDSDLFASV